MCDAYKVGRNVQPTQVGGILRAAPLEGGTETCLVHRADPSPVITASLGLRMMRWGFDRPKLGTIYNPREDKPGGPTWSSPSPKRS